MDTFDPTDPRERIVGLDKTLYDLETGPTTMATDPTALDSGSGEHQVSLKESAAGPGRASQRYEVDRVIGKGGMGAVLLARDRHIGRRVAMKVIHPDHAGKADAELRFAREARVQGQLEHPSVVPVYDLGIDPKGALYFTMKRIRGVGLDAVIKALREGTQPALEKYSRRRLLTAFSNVCLTVDYAHRHGVLHRDLKPANIMLGDFGEVNVLDWGIAKIMTDQDDDTTEVQFPPEPEPPGEATRGTIGTAGYISPERIRRHDDANRPASDVYSLGAILFEILAYTKLNRGMTPEDAIQATLAGQDARPSVRAPNLKISPELDEICVKASALDPAERFQSARELHDAVERYLDGQRDAELRKTLSDKHARAAADALRRAQSPQGSSLDERRIAMQNIGRALALDPNNEQAFGTMVQLLNAPTRGLPAEVQRQVEKSNAEEVRWSGRVASAAYLSFLLYLPFFFWAGIRDHAALSVFYILVILSAAASLWAGFAQRPGYTIPFVVVILSTAAFVATTTFFGPLVLAPALIAANTAAFAIVFDDWKRTFAILIGCLAICVPVVLELTSVLPASYTFGPSGMNITPRAIDLREAPAIAILAIGSMATIVTASICISRVRDSLSEAQRRLYLYAWHIRQLMPGSPPGPVDPAA